MRTFRRVALIGTGLIGGSVGLALRKKKIFRIGFDRPEVLRKAFEMDSIDRRARNLSEAVTGADLVILAMPVGAILEIFPEVARLAGSQTLITDVGSTKGAICRLAKDRRINQFLGGHPLAGKEKNGIDQACARLFAGKSWFLCPNGNSSALARMKNFVRLLGARPVVVEPKKHDRILAAASHLPQLVSSLLAATVDEFFRREGHRLKAFAGAGLRDTTRLAASSFSAWRDVFATNHLEIGRALKRFTERVNRVSDVASSSRVLERRFEEANAFMRRLK